MREQNGTGCNGKFSVVFAWHWLDKKCEHSPTQRRKSLNLTNCLADEQTISENSSFNRRSLNIAMRNRLSGYIASYNHIPKESLKIRNEKGTMYDIRFNERIYFGLLSSAIEKP